MPTLLHPCVRVATWVKPSHGSLTTSSTAKETTQTVSTWTDADISNINNFIASMCTSSRLPYDLDISHICGSIQERRTAGCADRAGDQRALHHYCRRYCLYSSWSVVPHTLFVIPADARDSAKQQNGESSTSSGSVSDIDRYIISMGSHRRSQLMIGPIRATDMFPQ